MATAKRSHKTTKVDVAEIAKALQQCDLQALRSADRIDESLDKLSRLGPLNQPEQRLREIASEMRTLVAGGVLT